MAAKSELGRHCSRSQRSTRGAPRAKSLGLWERPETGVGEIATPRGRNKDLATTFVHYYNLFVGYMHYLVHCKVHYLVNCDFVVKDAATLLLKCM